MSSVLRIRDENGVFKDIVALRGLQGEAATITLGTVSTGSAGSDVVITNSGDSNNAVFNFTIPCGATGVGISSIVFNETESGHSTAGVAGNTDIYTITFTDNTTFNYPVYNGHDSDMLTSIYDKNQDGIVDEADNAIQLNGQSADYYAISDYGNWD